MMNGWIGSKPLGSSHPHYSFGGIVAGVEVATGVALAGLVCVIVGDAIRRRYLRTAVARPRSPR
jgi:uncharacterized membrane protein